MKLALILFSAIMLNACSFHYKKEKQKTLPTEIILYGKEYIKMPNEFPKTNQNVNLSPSIVKKSWELPLGNNTIANCHFQQGYVFVTTKTNLLYLINNKTGIINWVINTPMEVKFPVGISDNRLYYASGDSIIEADLFSGKTLNIQRDLQNVSIPINGIGYYNQNIFVTTTNSHIQSHLLTEKIGTNWLKKVAQWIVKPLHNLSGPLLIVPPHIYYSDNSGDLTRIDALSGGGHTLKFSRPGFKPLHSPLVQENTIFQLFDDNTLYALNRHSMLVEWSYPMGIPKYKSPLLANGFIAISLLKGVDVITNKGKKLYHTNLIENPICFNKDNLIGLSKDNDLIALDKNGNQLWRQKQNNILKPATNNAFFAISKDKKNIGFYTTGYVKQPDDFKIKKVIKQQQ